MARDPRMQRLGDRLQGERPGLTARQRLSPRPHRGRLSGDVPDDARPAAVLMLLVPEGGLWMPLMRRQVVDGDRHSGQIAFPGGSFEAGENAVDAALRETHEELGVDPAGVDVLGQLDPQWIPVSGFVVHPVVATAGRRTELVCDPTEVELGFWVDVDALRRAPVRERDAARGERRFTMRGWELPEGFLWGATAMMLAELLALLDGTD
jgi:8-oxo-dGTP pyrophosphatase MutT (NUDIX family)